ncbi:MAG TPA: MFS transporter [Methylomirabilota bacterium]|nr:MFS transporter [Methylomirabilota bacterium]
MSAPVTTTAVPARTRLLGIAAAIGAITAVGTSMSLGLPLLAIVMETRGASTSLIGINTAMAGVASILVTPFVPLVAHRIGAAPFLAIVLVVATATFPLFYVFDDYTVWFVLRFLFHGSINVAFVLSEFWINALAPPGRRGLVMGIYATVLSLGFAVGPAILGVVGSAGVAPFVVGTAAMALATVPVLLALKANPVMDEKPRGSILRYVVLVPLATFAALTMGATESGMLSFIAIYGLRIGFNEATAVMLVSAVAVGNIVSQIPLGLISDRVDRRKLLLVIAVIATAIAAMIPLVADVTLLLFASLVVWGGVVAGLYTVGLTHLGARLSGSDLASANAAFILMYSFGMLAGPALVGAGMDVWDPHGLMVVAAAFTFGYSGLAAWRILRARGA